MLPAEEAARSNGGGSQATIQPCHDFPQWPPSASARSLGGHSKGIQSPQGELPPRSVPICSLGAPRSEERERADCCNSFTAFTKLGALSAAFQPLHKMLHGRQSDRLTHRSMTTGSEGVSLRLPHDFFSQHRLKVKQRETEKVRE